MVEVASHDVGGFLDGELDRVAIGAYMDYALKEGGEFELDITVEDYMEEAKQRYLRSLVSRTEEVQDPMTVEEFFRVCSYMRENYLQGSEYAVIRSAMYNTFRFAGDVFARFFRGSSFDVANEEGYEDYDVAFECSMEDVTADLLIDDLVNRLLKLDLGEGTPVFEARARIIEDMEKFFCWGDPLEEGVAA